MYVDKVLISTKVARSGMTIRMFFAECSRANTPGLPYCNDEGKIVGRVTLKNVLKNTWLPDYLVAMARVLGEQLSNVQDIEENAKETCDGPIDPYVQRPHLSVTPGSSAVKALALMEQSDTSYIYVVDEGRYLGVVTIHSLADKLARYDKKARKS